MLRGAGLTPEVLCPRRRCCRRIPGTLVVTARRRHAVPASRRHRPLPALPADDIGAALEASLGTELAQEHSDLLRHAAATGIASRARSRRCAAAAPVSRCSCSAPVRCHCWRRSCRADSYINLLSGDFALKLPAGRLAPLAPGGGARGGAVRRARGRTVAAAAAAAPQRARARCGHRRHRAPAHCRAIRAAARCARASTARLLAGAVATAARV